MAVVTDMAPGEDDAPLLRQTHYRTATPYVGLLVPGQPVRWVTGAPSAADLDAWANARH